MNYINGISFVQDGDPVAPSIANQPLNDLVNNTDYLKNELENHEQDQVAHEGFSNTLPDDLINKINTGTISIIADRLTGVVTLDSHDVNSPGHSALARLDHDHDGYYLTLNEVEEVVRNTTITKSKIYDFTDTDYVHTYGYEEVGGVKNFAITPRAVKQEQYPTSLVTYDFMKSYMYQLVKKGTVETFNDLPTNGNETGDYYIVLDEDGAIYVWRSTEANGTLDDYEEYVVPGLPNATERVFGIVKYSDINENSYGTASEAVQSRDRRLLLYSEAQNLREHYKRESTFFQDGVYKHHADQIRYFYDPGNLNTKISVDTRLQEIDSAIDRDNNGTFNTLNVAGNMTLQDVVVATVDGTFSGTINAMDGTITQVSSGGSITTNYGGIGTNYGYTSVNEGAINTQNGDVDIIQNNVVNSISSSIIQSMSDVDFIDATINADMTVNGNWATTGTFAVQDWIQYQSEGGDFVWDYAGV